MEGLVVAGFITVCIGIFVAIVIFAIKAEKKRDEALAQFAQQMGLTFEKKISGSGHFPCSSAALFSCGRSRYAKRYMTGKVADVDVILSDYQYTTGSGKNSTRHTLTLAAYHVPDIAMPDFSLESENFLTRLAEKFGMQDIDFDTHPEFSKTYRLVGKDEQRVRAFFTPNLLTSIENGLISKKWRVQAADNWLIIHSYPGRLKPEQWSDFLNNTFELMNKITVEAMS